MNGNALARAGTPTSVVRIPQLSVFEQAQSGIEHLRDMVVKLALMGQLATGRPSEPTAARLVEAAAKALGGQTRRTVSDLDPAPFLLPANWVWTQPQQLGFVSPRNEAAEEQTVGFVPMATVPTDYRQTLLPEKRTWGEVRKGYTHIADGDVVVAKITPCFQNKKSCVVEGLPGRIGAGTTELHVLRPIAGAVDSKYLLLFFKSSLFVKGGESRMTGTAGQQRVPSDYFACAPLPLPPLAEQKRIVAKLDDFMAVCDDLDASQTRRRELGERLTKAALGALTSAETPKELASAWEQVAQVLSDLIDAPSAVAELRLTILDLATRGRLVEQRGNEEPAEALRSRMARRRVGGAGSGIAVPDVARPFPLPRGWCWARLPELGEFGRGRSKHRPRNDSMLFRDGKYPLVQTGDVARANGVVTTFTGRYGEAGLAQSRLWPKGTLCITIAANIADSALLGFDACFPDSVVGLIPDPELGDARYIEYFMRTAKRHLEDFAPATAQKNINLEVLAAVAVPLPPKGEMKRIVARVDAMMSLCDDLEVKLRRRDEQATKFAGALAADAGRR